MCGIFSYIGNDQDAVLKTVKGLKDLEYRGYDSWGVAIKTLHGIYSQKSVGKISTVTDDDFKNVLGTVSIGHTRWATHGGVAERNAHPHWSRDKSIAVVHNGIVENHEELKEVLAQKWGNGFLRSETDTEVIPLLIDSFMEEGLLFEDAFLKTARILEGRFAFVAIHKDEPFVLAVRDGSPLVLGVGKGEHFLASDAPAFLDYTNTVYFFENAEYAKITTETASFYDLKTGKAKRKKTEILPWEKELATKGGHPHFMLKEILEERELIEHTVTVGATIVKKAVPIFKVADSIFFTAMGTAAHMGMAAEYIFSRIASVSARLVYAAEFDKVAPFLSKKSLVCGISQSGETADLLEAFRVAKGKKAQILSIINARGSSAERESFISIPITVGPEKAVASTKAALGQLTILTLLAYALVGKQKAGEKELRKVSDEIQRWLSDDLIHEVFIVAKNILDAKDLFVIGKSVNYPIALEAALKIKEVSYIHAEGFAAGELKHGTIALIEQGTPCVVLVSDDEYKNDVLSSAQELKARGACIIGIAPERNAIFDYYIPVPALKDVTSFALMISSHILAYHLAVLRGKDPDKPRNLAKSVTVK